MAMTADELRAIQPERARRWRAEHPDYWRDYMRKRRAAGLVKPEDPAKARERKRRTMADPENRRKEQARQREVKRILRDSLRNQLLGHYGRSCACCGTTARLTIDHINGNGKAHRQEIAASGNPVAMYRWIIANNYPRGFQVLCFPCNASKAKTAACRLAHEGR